MTKLLVIGHGRHGKDTVCEMLRDAYGWRFISSSLFAAERAVWPAIGDDYTNVLDMYEDRSNRRSEWFDAIAAYCSEDPARLAREMLDEGHDIYCGMRSRREFEAARPLFDDVVWVDRSAHLPEESGDSMQLCERDATVVLENNGSLVDLRDRVSLLHSLVADRSEGESAGAGIE